MSAAEDDRRHSTCLRPHTHSSEAGQGVARRRPRLHPHTHASEEGDKVAHWRSARLRPQVHAGEEASRVIRRSRRRLRDSSPAALPSPLQDDDLLWEILLRLPPQPSSLPRASAICKQWRCAVTDPRFHHRFSQHHRKPPLLGFFMEGVDTIVFKPILDSPDRIPPQRFDLRLHDIDSGSCSKSKGQMLGCRHGHVLLSGRAKHIVIAPITGEECHLSVPPEFKSGYYVTRAVLCAAVDHDHVHGSCHLSPFKVVLLSTSTYYDGPQFILASVYSSKAGIWGDVISTPTPCDLPDAGIHGSLVGNALYWLCRDYMIEFDLDGHILALISAPPTINEARHFFDMREVIQIVDGAVGISILSHYYHNIQMWQRKVNCQGVTKWVLWKTIEMRNIDGIPLGLKERGQGRYLD